MRRYNPLKEADNEALILWMMINQHQNRETP